MNRGRHLLIFGGESHKTNTQSHLRLRLGIVYQLDTREGRKFLFMKKSIFIAILTICFSGCVAQKKIPLVCNAVDIIDVGPTIQGFPSCGRCNMSVRVLNSGFKIVLSDSSYQIIGFKFSYAKNGGIVFEKENDGNQVSNQNLQYLQMLSDEGFLVIDCINIKKGNYQAISTSMTIGLTK